LLSKTGIACARGVVGCATSESRREILLGHSERRHHLGAGTDHVRHPFRRFRVAPGSSRCRWTIRV